MVCVRSECLRAMPDPTLTVTAQKVGNLFISSLIIHADIIEWNYSRDKYSDYKEVFCCGIH